MRRFLCFWYDDGRGPSSQFSASCGATRTMVKRRQLAQKDVRINRDVWWAVQVRYPLPTPGPERTMRICRRVSRLTSGDPVPVRWFLE